MKDLHTIKVPLDTWAKFKAFANEKGLKLQAAVGFALSDYIANNKKSKR